MNLSRSVYYYQSHRNDRVVIDKLQLMAEQRPTEGFWKMYYRIRKEGLVWNHKRIHRVYKILKFNIKRKGKRRLPARILQPLEAVQTINTSWSMDFMTDSLLSGRKFRTLNLMDDYNREALAIEVDTSLPAERVIRVLEQVTNWRGKPKRIRVDNGPEFISSALGLWCEEKGITLQFIQPGKPTQNAYIESFNGKFRDECLNDNVFVSLNSAQKIIEIWRKDYNSERPHSSLSKLTPKEFAARFKEQQTEITNLKLVQ